MTALATPPASRIAAPSVVPAALLFWAVCYGLFSYRVQLRGDEGIAALFALRRLVATGAGALLLAAVLRAFLRRGREAFDPLLLLGTIVAASVAMIVFRVAVDPLVSVDPEPLATHVRWVTTWAGYFGLGLCVAVAVHWRAARSSIREAAPPSPPDNLDWLAGVLASELPATERAMLAQRLLRRGGYPVADDPIGGENLRAEIAERLAAKLRERA